MRRPLSPRYLIDSRRMLGRSEKGRNKAGQQRGCGGGAPARAAPRAPRGPSNLCPFRERDQAISPPRPWGAAEEGGEVREGGLAKDNVAARGPPMKGQGGRRGEKGTSGTFLPTCMTRGRRKTREKRQP